MSKDNVESAAADTIEDERAELEAINQRGLLGRLGGYSKKCGPGWLQSAITLGGGSLAGALYLGVIGGTSFMWIQPLAMILGIIMLSAIAYVTLSSGRRPFRAVNEHVSPVLGWGWILATIAANIIWCLPQFNLAFGAISKNLFPSIGDSLANKCIVSGIVLAVAIVIVWSYGSGRKGIKFFETFLKIMVGLIVISFVGVVVMLTVSKDSTLSWPEVFKGFVPDFGSLFRPSETFAPFIAQTADPDMWTTKIVGAQRDVIMAAFATAVGINMTFLLPYSMLKRGWGKEHRGLAIFDLSTGLFIPFFIATGCLVIAAATQFHDNNLKASTSGILVKDLAATIDPGEFGGLLGQLEGDSAKAFEAELEKYSKANPSEDPNQPDFAKLLPSLSAGTAGNALKIKLGDDYEGALTSHQESLPADKKAESRIEMMLAKRNQWDLATALEPFAGKEVSQYVFGFGVLAMAISTIIILMLINGFAFCEIANVAPSGNVFRIGTIIAGAAGFFGPILWGKLGASLAIPTSVIGLMLLPIAYFAFFFMMNSKSLMGENIPTGFRKLRWNVLMLVSALVATFGAGWAIKSKMAGAAKSFGVSPEVGGWIGIGIFAFIGLLVVLTFRGNKAQSSE